MEEFQFLATQGFVKLSAMQEMRQYPVFVSEEWAHVLAWSFSPTGRRRRHALHSPAFLKPPLPRARCCHARLCGHALSESMHVFHRDLFVGRYVYLDGACLVYLGASWLSLTRRHTHTHFLGLNTLFVSTSLIFNKKR